MLPVHVELLRKFRDLSLTAPTAKSLMEHISQLLHEKMARYNWVGFYVVDPADPGILLVGPFVGSFTPNARIPLAAGLCGATTSGQTVVVDGVTKDPRYLSGPHMVHSEVVVPIFVKNKLAAELDIESYIALQHAVNYAAARYLCQDISILCAWQHRKTKTKSRNETIAHPHQEVRQSQVVRFFQQQVREP
jgi:putative methionine-R-sulfoxide reductase with GAF domain